MRTTKMYKDIAGNILYMQRRASGAVRYFAKNSEGKLVNMSGVKDMFRSAKIKFPKRYKHIK